LAKKISIEYQQLTDCAKELNKLKNMQIEALTRIRRMSSIYFNSEQRAMSRNIKEFESDISYSISINNKSVSSTVDLVNYLNKAVRDFSAAEQGLNQMINRGSKIKDIENNAGALLNVWGEELTSINKNELKSLPNTAEKLKENIMNDFSAIWKSFDKNDEELNKVITAANTIIKAAWNYHKEEHPIEAGIESSLANFATSTIKGIGGILNGVGEQWYELREDPKGTLKNWWNFTVDVVSFLSPNLPKTEDDLNFEYNLANSIIKDGDTRLVHGDAYSRTQYIADWVLNIGSLFLGGEALDSIKGLGKTSDVLEDTSKLEMLSQNHPIVEEIKLKTSMESIRTNKDLISFEDTFSRAMENENMTMAEYIKLTHTPISKLSETNIKRIYAINSSVGNPSNTTLMSKVIPKKVYLNCIENGQFSDTVGNCVTRSQDMQDCYTFDDYYNKLGLNYDNSPFNTADEMYIMRYTSQDTEALITRSYGGTTIEDVKTAQNILGLNENNTFLNKDPYLGTGVTKDVEGGIGKMELITMKDNLGNAQYCSIDDGSAIYEISRDNNIEKIVAIRYNEKWWRVK
jgi:hypothetical protein